MRVALLVGLAAASFLTACVQAAQPTPKTDEEKALYSLGVILASNIQSFEFTDKELELVKAGLADGAKDQAKLEPEAMEAYIPKLQELQQTRSAAALERQKKAGSDYLAKAAAEAGAVKTDSGLVYKATKEGSGASPVESDVVQVHYEGKLVSGKVFDSSRKRNEPTTFPLSGVIPCWSEGVQKMKVGGTALIVCPPELAYGDRGSPPQMPGGATLIFDVELLDIVKEEPTAPASEAPAVPGQ